MAHHRTSAWTWVLIAGLLLFGGVYLVLIIGGSGLMPGDVPVDATVNPAETEGGGAPTQDLGAFPWTAVVLIGTAILGYREGDVFDWRTRDRTCRIRISRVLYQPEAAGDFHL